MKKKIGKQREQINVKYTDVSTNMFLITLNINWLNIPFKRQEIT